MLERRKDKMGRQIVCDADPQPKQSEPCPGAGSPGEAREPGGETQPPQLRRRQRLLIDTHRGSRPGLRLQALLIASAASCQKDCSVVQRS